VLLSPDSRQLVEFQITHDSKVTVWKKLKNGFSFLIPICTTQDSALNSIDFKSLVQIHKFLEVDHQPEFDKARFAQRSFFLFPPLETNQIQGLKFFAGPHMGYETVEDLQRCFTQYFGVQFAFAKFLRHDKRTICGKKEYLQVVSAGGTEPIYLQ
jgi:hypothetical protein